MTNEGSLVVSVNPKWQVLIDGGLHADTLSTWREVYCKGCTEEEFVVFALTCIRTGLSPEARQIFAVRRYDKKLGREVMGVQVSVDGLRLIAQRSACYGGQTAVEWCGLDGKWVDVWLKDTAPAAARVGVIRKDWSKPLYAVATMRSYCQTTRDGQPMGLWRNMPDVMIAKCAESLALRKAFPQECGGLYTREEMSQASPEAIEAELDVNVIDVSYEDVEAQTKQETRNTESVSQHEPNSKPAQSRTFDINDVTLVEKLVRYFQGRGVTDEDTINELLARMNGRPGADAPVVLEEILHGKTDNAFGASHHSAAPTQTGQGVEGEEPSGVETIQSAV